MANSEFRLSYEQLIQISKQANIDPRTLFADVLVEDAVTRVLEIQSQQELQSEINSKKKEAFTQFKVNVLAIVTEAIGVMHLAKVGESFIFGDTPEPITNLLEDFLGSVEELYFHIPERRNGTRKGSRISSGSRQKWYIDGEHLKWKCDGINKYNPLYQICEMLNLGELPIYHVKMDVFKSHLIKYIPVRLGDALKARNFDIPINEFLSLGDEQVCEVLSELLGKTVEVR